MAITGIAGDTGAGKTLTQVYLLDKWRANYKILTNFDYQYADSRIITMEDIKKSFTSISGQKIYGFDELWCSTDSRRSSSQENITFFFLILQARKGGGSNSGDCHIIYTVQDPSQIDKRLRINTSRFLYPQILLCKTTPEGSRPYIVKVDITDKYGNFMSNRFFDVYSACDHYARREFIEATPSVDIENIVNQYPDLDRYTKKSLAAKLYFESKAIKGSGGLSKTESRDLSEYIFLRNEKDDNILKGVKENAMQKILDDEKGAEKNK